MSKERLSKWWAGLSSFGPYILIELLLPGGTLLALLLWLSQRFNRGGSNGVRRSSVAATQCELALEVRASAPAVAASQPEQDECSRFESSLRSVGEAMLPARALSAGEGS